MLVGAITAGAAVTTGYAALGFWWFDGAAETRRQYWAGTAQFRPLIYFALANLAVALIAIGPHGFEGLIRTVTRRKAASQIAPLVIGGAVALAASHLSQYTRAEVERIWLLFYPWLMISGGLVISNDERRVGAIAVAAQVVTAVLLQAALVSKW
jgi:methylthioxylose transferase